MGGDGFPVTLGSRPPEFLHKYHHATTFWLFCLVINLPGPEKFGLLLNGGVHTLMYAHYWRPFPKPLVPLITALQIAQLTTVTYAWYASPRVCPAASFADAPRAHRLEVLTPYVMVPGACSSSPPSSCPFLFRRRSAPARSATDASGPSCKATNRRRCVVFLLLRCGTAIQ